MRVLAIFNFIYDDERGATIVAKNHLKLFKLLFGSDLKIIALPGRIIKDANDNIIIKSVNTKIISKIINLFHGNTGRINDKITKEIIQLIKKDNIDLVYIDDSIFGKLVKRIKKEIPNVIVVTYYHDVKAYLARQWMKKSPHKYLVYKSLIKNEYLTQQSSDYNLVLNNRENNMFMKYYHKSASALLPITLSEPNLTFNLEKYSKKILFVGAYYYPNVEGIKWFIKEVFSKISDEYSLCIVGNGMEKLNDEIEKSSRIEVHGRVEDLTEYYINSYCVIGPIYDGGGMKVKTAEAMSYGKVYVGTSESLEGYLDNNDVKDLLNKYIFLCNSAEDFINFFNTNKLFKPFEQNISQVFKNNYSIDAGKKLFEKIINGGEVNGN